MTDIDPLVGTVIGEKYRIVRYLAEGGMGAVYEAVHVVVQRRFAIKFLHSEFAQRRDALARFKQEATAAGLLEDEHIAAVVDFGITPAAAPYLVMEYLEGLDLGQLIEVEDLLSMDRACDLTIQACAGVSKAHERGIIHRDLKPSNLFVCRRADGTDLLKVMDFGVAKFVEGEASSAVTRTGSIVGTPAYMSPEQARGESPVDHRADIHALGVILYELLCGRTPHPGDSFNAIIHHLATQQALPLVCAGREYPSALRSVVERALSLQPEDRYASASELAAELQPFARRLIWPPFSFQGPTPGRFASRSGAEPLTGADSQSTRLGPERDSAHRRPSATQSALSDTFLAETAAGASVPPSAQRADASSPFRLGATVLLALGALSIGLLLVLKPQEPIEPTLGERPPGAQARAGEVAPLSAPSSPEAAPSSPEAAPASPEAAPASPEAAAQSTEATPPSAASAPPMMVAQQERLPAAAPASTAPLVETRASPARSSSAPRPATAPRTSAPAGDGPGRKGPAFDTQNPFD